MGYTLPSVTVLVAEQGRECGSLTLCKGTERKCPEDIHEPWEGLPGL
jgi:hypothetical protein